MKETSLNPALSAIAILALTLCACDFSTNDPAVLSIDSYEFTNSLAIQKRKSYPEIVSGRFVTLADFENDTKADDVVENMFLIVRDNGSIDSNCKTVLSPSMTGSASLSANLSPGDSLSMRLPKPQDLGRYNLLSMAVHIDHPRDDLRVLISSPDGKNWQSPTLLLTPGWNKVLLDITNKPSQPDSFNLCYGNAVELSFAAAKSDIALHIDDLMLIDNRRIIPGGPKNLTLTRHGLNYTVEMNGHKDARFTLAAGSDGLFRMSGIQPLLSLMATDDAMSDTPAVTKNIENISLMGMRRLGETELLEINPLRIRLRSSWYFPPEAGRWVDMNVRRITWDYCFYDDGRVVVAVLMNNAGGNEILSASINSPLPACTTPATPPAPPATPGAPNNHIGRIHRYSGLDGQVLQAAMLMKPPASKEADLKCGYGDSGQIEIFQGKPGSQDKPGEANEAAATSQRIYPSQQNQSLYNPGEGCYVLRASGGNCRFILKPATEPLVRPVIKILGNWRDEKVSLSCNGLAVRPVVKIDGGILAVINETLRSPALIELRSESTRP